MIPKRAAEELTDDLTGEEPEEAPKRTRERERSSVSPPSGLRETASLISLIQANMREQSDRIGHHQETFEKHNTIFGEIIEQLKALGEILEDHTASLEESLERIETVTAAYIKMIEHQTNRRNERNEPTAATTNQ